MMMRDHTKADRSMKLKEVMARNSLGSSIPSHEGLDLSQTKRPSEACVGWREFDIERWMI
jgi:hypothetical protein